MIIKNYKDAHRTKGKRKTDLYLHIPLLTCRLLLLFYYYLYLQLVQSSKKQIETNYPVNAIYGFHVKNCIKC